MKRIGFLFCLLTLFSSAAFAHEQLSQNTPTATGDSVRYLTPQDTVVMYASHIGKYFYHTFMPQQTLYSLASHHGLSLEELYYYNPDLRGRSAVIGERIIIPLANKLIIRYPLPDKLMSDYAPLFYEVRAGDTAYGIAKTTFDMPIDTLLKRNGLTSATLKLGMLLRIGWVNCEPQPKRSNRVSAPLVVQANMDKYKAYEREATVKKRHKTRGPAVWMQEKGSQPSGFYVSHPTLPKHSLVKITNPMNHRVVYCEILGNLPKGTYDRETVCVLSSAAAKALGARDPKFYVHLEYLR